MENSQWSKIYLCSNAGKAYFMDIDKASDEENLTVSHSWIQSSLFHFINITQIYIPRQSHFVHFKVCLGQFPELYGTFQLWWGQLFQVNASYTEESQVEIITTIHRNELVRILKKKRYIQRFWFYWDSMSLYAERESLKSASQRQGKGVLPQKTPPLAGMR